jgi:hypothetical protein
MVNALGWFMHKSGFIHQRARAADDAEAGWNPGFTATHNFLAGYAAHTWRPLFDFGGFAGGGWSLPQEYYVAAGTRPVRPFAEVYYSHQAYEWEALNQWSVRNRGHRIIIRGVMSQYPHGGYTAHQGYNIMMQALNSFSGTRQSNISYLTRIAWGEGGATAAGVSANGMAGAVVRSGRSIP